MPTVLEARENMSADNKDWTAVRLGRALQLVDVSASLASATVRDPDMTACMRTRNNRSTHCLLSSL